MKLAGFKFTVFAGLLVVLKKPIKHEDSLSGFKAHDITRGILEIRLIIWGPV